MKKSIRGYAMSYMQMEKKKLFCFKMFYNLLYAMKAKHEPMLMHMSI